MVFYGFPMFFTVFFTDFYGRITLVAGITEIYGHFTYVSVKFMVIVRLGVRFYGNLWLVYGCSLEQNLWSSYASSGWTEKNSIFFLQDLQRCVLTQQKTNPRATRTLSNPASVSKHTCNLFLLL